MSTLRGVFEDIYERNLWGFGSGDGSLPRYLRRYIALLERILQEPGVRSVADLGCGDWQFSRLVDWSGVEYDGYDVVRPVVAENTRQFAAPNIRFHLIDGDPAEIADADLLIVKDVLQHWTTERIHGFLPHLKRFRYALVTNSVDHCGPTSNREIEDGHFQPLDLRQPPFGLKAEVLDEFYAGARRLLPWRPRRRTLKRVLLVDTARSRSE